MFSHATLLYIVLIVIENLYSRISNKRDKLNFVISLNKRRIEIAGIAVVCIAVVCVVNNGSSVGLSGRLPLRCLGFLGAALAH